MREGDTEILAKLEQVRIAAGGAASASVPATVAGKYRFKADGTFQLYNATTSKYHTLSLSGPDGSVTIDIGAGQA